MNVAIYNSTFSGNRATVGHGGAIYNSKAVGEATLTMYNSTVADNFASDNGGGLYNEDGTIHLINTLIANSMGGGDCFNKNGNLATNINNFIGDNSCSPAFSGDPLLGPLVNNGGSTYTHALLVGSPAIDSGDNVNCLAIDQRYFNRPEDGNMDAESRCDIGAYEYIYRPQMPFAVYLPFMSE